MSAFLDFARDTVLAASESIKGFRLSQKIQDKNYGDLVTAGDLNVEKIIAEAIFKRYPDHGLLSEEGAIANPGAEYEWVLDPIDGTKYYTRGVPLYTISLALRKDNELVLGVVHSPEYNSLFSAEEGEGAYLGKRRITCSDASAEEKMIVCAEIPGIHSHTDIRRRAMDRFQILLDNVLRVRMMGSSALAMCWTAMGGYDAYVNLGSGSKIWDIAAGLVVLKESGAEITGRDGKIIAANPAMHDKLIDLLEI
ncbi:MAG: hypothetical protein DRP46_12980 [Candidatus Zixiibacteriota bacterium]|nr:MAG: hypothetical protein DRP46_12980 [candidate division Zixibacteria bacterium]